MKYLFFLSVCSAVLFACSKTDHVANANTSVPPVTSVTIRIDTVITYTPPYYQWIGSAKTFDFPDLDGVSNPVLNVYYKTANQTSWKILPDGYTAWFRRNGRSITVFVTFANIEMSVKIIAAW